MGLFDLFKKSQRRTITEKIEITAHEPNREEMEQRRKAQAVEKIKNYQKDEAGLYPHEILMLSYLEKYAAGKEPARFWEYEYGVDDVPALIKSLENQGFAEGGKLTDPGKEEIRKNEYVLYMHKHKFPDISMADMCILVNKNQGMPYRDLLWAEFNRLSGEYIESGRIALYRNIRYTMYNFLVEEKRYKSAFGLLAEVFFYDLNGDESPFIAPRLVKNFQDLEQKTDYSEDELNKEVFKTLEKAYAPRENFSVGDISRMIISFSFGNADIAESIFETGKARIEKEPIVFKSTLTSEQRKRANIRVK